MPPFISRIIVIALVPAAQLLVGEVGAQSLIQDSVTGHADFINRLGNHIRYSLSAIRHRDGSVSGELQEHAETPAGELIRKVHGTVICFTVNGNVARVGGISDRRTGADVLPPGTEFFLTVVDNGEGDNEPRDLASIPQPVASPGSAITHCTVGIPQLLFPIDRGEIQIRPSGF